jgi:hypothetical protein
MQYEEPSEISLGLVKPSHRLGRMFLRVDRFLGQCRALEIYLGSVKTLFGIFLLPEQKIDHAFIVFQDILWWYPNWYVAVPFLVLGIAQIFGVVGNHLGWRWSWKLRAFCAFAAEFIWAMVIFRHLQLAAITGLLPFAIMATVANFWIWWTAWNELPPAGRLA